MEAIKSVLDDRILGEKMAYEITNGEFLALITHVSGLGYILASVVESPTVLFKEKNASIIDLLLTDAAESLDGIMPAFLESMKEKATEEQKATLDKVIQANKAASNELKKALSAANTPKH